jgi:hypothetical protein
MEEVGLKLLIPRVASSLSRCSGLTSINFTFKALAAQESSPEVGALFGDLP